MSINLDAVVPDGDRTAPICMANIDDLAAGARRLIQRDSSEFAAEELQQYGLEQAGVPRCFARLGAQGYQARAVTLLELYT